MPRHRGPLIHLLSGSPRLCILEHTETPGLAQRPHVSVSVLDKSTFPEHTCVCMYVCESVSLCVYESVCLCVFMWSVYLSVSECLCIFVFPVFLCVSMYLSVLFLSELILCVAGL